MEISFIHLQMLVHLGLALKQRLLQLGNRLLAPRMKASRITCLHELGPAASPLWVLLFPHKTFIILEGSCCISHKNILFWTWVNYSLPYWKGPGHFLLLLKKVFWESLVGGKRCFFNTVWIRISQFEHVQDLKVAYIMQLFLNFSLANWQVVCRG